MTYVKDMLLPRLAEGMDSARVVHWAVARGESFSANDTLMEIETDKSVVEVPASEDGRLVEQLVAIDDTVGPDEPIARIEVAGEAPTAQIEKDVAEPGEDEASAAAAPLPEVETPESGPAAPVVQGDRQLATPIARRLAAENGLDLTTVEGSGRNGRVVKVDVMSAMARGTGESIGSVSDGAGDGQIGTSHGMLHFRRWVPDEPVSRTTVVLLHGLFGDVDVWASTANELNRAGLTVVGLDLSCHGLSESTATRFEDIADAAGEAIRATVEGSFALVGHSLGAGIAIRIAHRARSEVVSLSLLAPIGLGTEIEQSFLDGMIHGDTPGVLQREMRKLTVAGTTPSSDYLKMLCERLRSRREFMLSLVRGISDSGVQQIDLVPKMEELECPVTLIHGRSDKIVPWSHALNAPPRTALHLLPRVGHMPQWEASALICQLIAGNALRD